MTDFKEFQVYIVESPSSQDLFDDRSEGKLIQQALAIAEIRTTLKVAVDEKRFTDALLACGEELKSQQADVPVLHISAHGNEKGIQLTNKEFLAWADLEKRLAELNEALHGQLILCMSSCEGARAWNMALNHNPRAYSVLIGSEEKPTWSETAIGFAAFYHLLAVGKTVKGAVDGMNAACGRPIFIQIDGKEVQALRETVMQMSTDELHQFRAQMGLPRWHGSTAPSRDQ
jgi:hypothetical protein